jgi:hypothetical protein
MMSAEPEETASATARLEKVEAELAETIAELQIKSRLLEDAERFEALSRQREALLEAELQNRVRNMLAVVRSIFSRTAETRTSTEELADHFRGRLDALARYYIGSPGVRGKQLNVADAVWESFSRWAPTARTGSASPDPNCC